MYGYDRDEFNLFVDSNIAETECSSPFDVMSSPSKEGTLCIDSMYSHLIPQFLVQGKKERAHNGGLRDMYGLEKFLGVSYEGFE
jgi:hypothetical protein